MEQKTGGFYITAGERLAEAGNHLIGGIQDIQKLVNRPEPRKGDDPDFVWAFMAGERETIADICKKLVGAYKIIVVELSQVDEFPKREG